MTLNGAHTIAKAVDVAELLLLNERPVIRRIAVPARNPKRNPTVALTLT